MKKYFRIIIAFIALLITININDTNLEQQGNGALAHKINKNFFKFECEQGQCNLSFNDLKYLKKIEWKDLSEEDKMTFKKFRNYISKISKEEAKFNMWLSVMKYMTWNEFEAFYRKMQDSKGIKNSDSEHMSDQEYLHNILREKQKPL